MKLPRASTHDYYRARIAHFQRTLSEGKLCDAFLVSKPENVYYVSRFRGDDSCVFVTPAGMYFITDKRYSDEASSFFKSHPHIKVIVAQGKQNRFVLCKQLMRRHRVCRLGCEARHLTYQSVNYFKTVIGEKKCVPLNDFIELMRLRKAPDELTAIQKAIDLNEKVFAYVKRFLTVGVSERDIVIAAETYMRKLGADNPSFPTIIAAGKKTAFPHAVSDTTKIVNNNLVLVDMGTKVEAYCSDMTRTFILGKMPSFFKKVYGLVLEAQAAAYKQLRPGVPIREIVRAVNVVFRRAGYLSHFTHAVGHGIGLEVHEQPSLSSRTPLSLEEGMVLTIEPALYFLGRGGVRIEDMVYVTNRGYEHLSHYPRRLEDMYV